MLHEIEKMPGFKSFVVCNNQGIVLRYIGMEYTEAVHIATLCLDLMEKSKAGSATLFPSIDAEVENVRLKTKKYELIMSQINNFTLIVNQSFEKHHHGEGEDEEGEEEAS